MLQMKVERVKLYGLQLPSMANSSRITSESKNGKAFKELIASASG